MHSTARGCEHLFVPSGRATILHADLDAFYASVEQRDAPELAGRPVIVGGGVVVAASYEAKAFGVRTAMGGGAARRLCPHAVVVPPRFEAYVAASEAVFAVFHETTPLVERLSIDEAFLDVGGLARLAGEPLDIARRLRAEVRDRVGLPITVGIARTKFLAKVASRTAKPDGILVVPPDEERAFLEPLPVDRLWGVGPKTAEKLAARGITTVGEVARLDERVLVSLLGRAVGRHLHALAHNRDPRPVTGGKGRASIGSQHAIGRGPHSDECVAAQLTALVERVTKRLRAAERAARSVVLRLRFGDYTRVTRSHTLAMPTASTSRLVTVAHGLLDAARPLIDERGITLIGVSLTDLRDATPVQLALPFARADRGDLDAATDRVRDRFGSSALRRAAMLGRDEGFSVPMLPD